jgi:hypothetical protein
MSVRISDGDAAFLAQLQIPGATTPSEKLRAVLREARRRHEETNDYDGCLGLIREMTEPARRHLRKFENERKIHSEFVGKLYDWLPEILATLIVFRAGDENDLDNARAFESDLAEKVIVLVEAVLHLGITRQARAYDPMLMTERLDGALELTDIVARMRAQTEGSKQ